MDISKFEAPDGLFVSYVSVIPLELALGVFVRLHGMHMSLACLGSSPL